MKARIAATLMVTVGVLGGTTGCSLFAPQATTTHYEASDGVGADIGELAVRNAIVVSDDGKTGNLVVTVVNRGATGQTLGVQYKSAVGRTNGSIAVDAKKSVILGTGVAAPLALKDIASAPGSLMPIYFQYGDVPGRQLLVPVLTTAQSAYRSLGPTPSLAPTPPTAPATHH